MLLEQWRRRVPATILVVIGFLALAACSDTRPVPGTAAQPDMATPAGRMTAQLVKALQTCWLDRREFSGVTLVGPQRDWRGTYHVALREAEGTPRPNRNIDFSISETSGRLSVSAGPLHAYNYGDEFNKLTKDVMFQKPPCPGLAAAKIHEPKTGSSNQ